MQRVTVTASSLTACDFVDRRHAATVDDSDPRAAHAVRDELRASFPELSLSMFVVRYQDISKVRSYFGRDLVLGSASPLHGVVTVRPDALPSITLRSRLEVVVHQLSNVLLHDRIDWESPGHAREQLPAQLTKTGLEALRALLPVPERGCARYADVACLATARLPSTRTAPTAAATIARYAVDLVRCRELGVGHLPAEVIHGLVTAALRLLLQVPDGPNGEVEYVETLTRLLGTSGSETDTYQYLVIGLSSLPILGAAGRGAMRAGLSQAVARLLVRNPAAWPVGMAVEIGPSSETLEPGFLAGLAELRREYYAQIGPHNFGRRAIDGYDELALQTSFVPGLRMMP